MSEDRCVVCGEIIPEGRQVCPDCETPSSPIDIEILKKAISTFGKKHQVDMAIEEMSELTKALLKERRSDYTNAKAKREATENVIEEMADVYIMLMQMIIIFDKDNKIRSQIDFKIDRLKKIIKKERGEDEK